jgi:hypothetical protein
MLRMMRNKNLSDNEILERSLSAIEGTLPPSWTARRGRTPSDATARPDAVIYVTAPDGTRSELWVEARRRLDPKDVSFVLEQLNAPKVNLGTASVIAAPYLGERTRERLKQEGIGYVDLTGNLFLLVEEPAIYVERQGADRDPWRSGRGARSLAGPMAGRVVRALCDFRPPLGVRRLAEMAETDAGWTSRILRLLEAEALVTRGQRGGVAGVDWPGLLRAWSRDYSLAGSNRVRSYLQPRGVSVFVDSLRGVGRERGAFLYAVTGSLAAVRVAPVAPAALAVCFTDDAALAARSLGLVATDAGANVLLVEPLDRFVYERRVVADGVSYVAPSQAVADLLTGPGRNPTEAEALIDWMRVNEGVWRA